MENALLVEFARQGIGVVDPRVGTVEGGIETGDLRRFGKGSARCGRAHAQQVMWLVQRRERSKPVQACGLRSSSTTDSVNSTPPFTIRGRTAAIVDLPNCRSSKPSTTASAESWSAPSVELSISSILRSGGASVECEDVRQYSAASAIG